MSELVSYVADGPVAIVTMDDGKVNAFSHPMMEALEAAFGRAAAEGRAVALLGRPGVLCAGFDLKVMKSGTEAARKMMKTGLALKLSIFLHPRPVVVGCTGHAMAGGAILLLVGDYRLAAAGDFRVSLTEVAIGLAMPRSANLICAERISRKYLTRAVVNAEVFDPQTALEAGFVDAVVDPDELATKTVNTAHALAGLPAWSFRDTKLMMREEVALRANAMLEEEMSALIPQFV